MAKASYYISLTAILAMLCIGSSSYGAVYHEMRELSTSEHSTHKASLERDTRGEEIKHQILSLCNEHKKLNEKDKDPEVSGSCMKLCSAYFSC